MKKVVIKIICDYLEKNFNYFREESYNKNLSDNLRDKLEEITGYKYSYINTIFKKDSGMSIVDYFKKKALMDAVYEADERGIPLSEVIEQKSFWSDATSFGKAFKKYYETTPSKHIKDWDTDLDVYYPDIDLINEGNITINIIDDSIKKSEIAKPEIAHKCGVKLSKLEYYCKNPMEYVPRNIESAIANSLNIDVRELYQEVCYEDYIKKQDKKSLFNDENKKELIEILEEYGLKCCRMGEYYVDTITTVFLDGFIFEEKNYDFRFAVRVRRVVNDFDLTDMRYNLTLEFLPKNSIMQYNQDELEKFYSQIMKVLIKYCYLNNIGYIRVVMDISKPLHRGAVYKIFNDKSINMNLITEKEIINWT